MNDVTSLYQRHAGAFARDRGRHFLERRYIDAAIAHVSAGGPVLDLGCGAGEPIAAHLISCGLSVTGVDAAPEMIELCRQRHPCANWVVADMRTLELGQRFDAIIAWDSFFHLTRDAQRLMFPIFAAHAASGGALLFNSGPADGEAIGDLYGEPLFHASLAADEYRTLLSDNGFTVLDHVVEDPACGGRTIWRAHAR